MKTYFTFPLLIFGMAAYSQQVPTADQQIQWALLAVPEDFKEEATVKGYNMEGEMVTLRAGSNPMIALTDDPNKAGFSVAAYHKELEPFMARGRELRASGQTYQEVFEQRESEVKSGKLKIPQGSTLFAMSGEFDESGQPVNTYLRYVVYIPFATSESTGLPPSSTAPGSPWIMDPGTHRAHIMINPPKN